MLLRLNKLRPVGSHVYSPAPPPWPAWPWDGEWLSCFTPSGTAALAMAVALACQRKSNVEKPEVIIPAYGCPDLVAALVFQGAVPILVDLAPNSPWMDLDALKASITGATVAIVAVDFLGMAERLSVIAQLAAERGLFLIEDSAQRFPPASISARNVDCAVISFGRGKPINLMGGGLLLVHEAHRDALMSVSRRLPRLRSNHSVTGVWKRWLFNLILSRWLYVWLERMPFLHLGETRFKPLIEYGVWEPDESLLAGGVMAYARRPDWSGVYDRALAFLEDGGWRCLPMHRSGESKNRTCLLRYPVLAPNTALRNQALAALNASGIGANAFYGAALPGTIGTAEHLRQDVLERRYEHAEDFAARLLTLPCHEDVKQRHIDRAAGVLAGICTR